MKAEVPSPKNNVPGRTGRGGRVTSRPETARSGSVLIIVLWIAFGLVALALYFADSMSFELRASDNRVSAQSADQAIEGAARYINYILATQAVNGSNGFVPDPSTYACRAVPVGDARFWLIGRDTNNAVGPGQMAFGLVDEASKLNLNYAISNQLVWLTPRMTADLTQGILDWRDTNGTGPTVTYYAMQQPAYLCKSYPFETVDELRMVYGASMDILIGEDANRNGILDVPYENDDNQNSQLDPGIIEYLTVYTREPNTNSDGSAKINISSLSGSSTQLSSLLTTNFGASRANQILTSLGLGGTGPGTAPGGGGRAGTGARAGAAAAATVSFTSPLQLYARSRMTSTEFSQVESNFTTVSGPFVEGRVNVNTASATVLTCLFGGDSSAAQQLISYRLANPNNLASIAWIVDALGQNYADALTTLEAGDYVTTQSYQFSADVAAVGPYGRGYRRVRFIFDTSSGSPQIVFRQDLTHLGWALGAAERQNVLLAKANP